MIGASSSLGTPARCEWLSKVWVERRNVCSEMPVGSGGGGSPVGGKSSGRMGAVCMNWNSSLTHEAVS